MHATGDNPYGADRRAPVPADYAERVRELAATNRGDAVAYFMTEAVGVPAEFVEQMKQAPMWPSLERVAPTLAYDGEVMGETMRGKPLPKDRWANATMPVMVVGGGASEEWMRTGAKSAADVLPNGTYRMLEGQDHDVSPDALAPLLIEFFTSEQTPSRN